MTPIHLHDYGTSCTICGATLNTELELERQRCDEHRYHNQRWSDIKAAWCKFFDITGTMLWEWVYSDNPYDAVTQWHNSTHWCTRIEKERWIRYRLYRLHLWLTEHLTPRNY